jgi:hypothetical protein
MTNKKFLIIDTSNMMHRAKHVTSGDIWTRIGLTIHIMLNGIRKSWIKTQADHVIFCLEGHSWRHSIYEPYKANRRAAKANISSGDATEDQMFFDAINNFIQFIDEHTNCTVLQNEYCEADDLIARFIQTHQDDNHVIISGDTDFIQLVSDNVSIYDGVKDITLRHDGIYDGKDKRAHFSVKNNSKIKVGKAIKPGEKEEYDPEWIDWALFLKFVRGDPGDNIFSAYPRANIKKIKGAFDDRFDKGYDWNNFMLHRWTDHNKIDHRVKNCYDRNRELIDLSMQPEEIKIVMDDTINEAIAPKHNTQIGIRFLKYAGKNELTRIAENPSDYISFLTAKYN